MNYDLVKQVLGEMMFEQLKFQNTIKNMASKYELEKYGFKGDIYKIPKNPSKASLEASRRRSMKIFKSYLKACNKKIKKIGRLENE